MPRLLPRLLGLASAAALLLAVAGCDSEAPTTETVPVTTTFNVSTDGCGVPDTRTFRRVALTTHAAVWADTRNPLPTLTDAEYQAVADSFEAVVWPTDTRVFGTPSDIDGNGRVHLAYTTGVNDLSPANSTAYIGGFFFARDLFPRKPGLFNGINFGNGSECASSNQAEILYMLAPDEAGTVKGNARSRALVRRVTLGTVAHELQHLINASGRVYRSSAGAFEDTWLDEGLSHIAEELSFYAAGPAQPLQNYDLNGIRATETRRLAFNKLMTQNMARFNDYLKKGPTSSPYDTNDSLATRGAAWAFLRYLADRKGGDQEAFFRAIVQSGVQGMASVQRGLGGSDPYPFLSGFHVATLADDQTPTAPALQQPSWNFRDVLTLFGGYPVQTYPLTAGFTTRVTVDGGAAAFFRAAVAPLGEGTVRVGEAGLLPSGTCATTATRVSLAVGETQTLPVGPAALCLVGGPAGAEFAVVAVHASPAKMRNPSTGDTEPNETLTINALGTGIATSLLTSPALPAPSFALLAEEGADAGSRALEMDIRRRERALVLPGTRMRPAFSVLGGQGIANLAVTVLRTR